MEHKLLKNMHNNHSDQSLSNDSPAPIGNVTDSSSRYAFTASVLLTAFKPLFFLFGCDDILSGTQHVLILLLLQSVPLKLQVISIIEK